MSASRVGTRVLVCMDSWYVLSIEHQGGRCKRQTHNTSSAAMHSDEPVVHAPSFYPAQRYAFAPPPHSDDVQSCHRGMMAVLHGMSEQKEVGSGIDTGARSICCASRAASISPRRAEGTRSAVMAVKRRPPLKSCIIAIGPKAVIFYKAGAKHSPVEVSG